MGATTGRVTIPSEAGFAATTRDLARRWGADAVRDSDGTSLDAEVTDLGLQVYSAYFPVRGHNEFIAGRPRQRPQTYLLSDRLLAGEGPLEVDLLRSYYAEQLAVNTDDDPHRWWEVVDRTTGAVVPVQDWTVSPDGGTVTLTRPQPWHEYTVAFLAYVTWDPVEMYNHLTNGWGDKEHEVPFDVRHPESAEFVRSTFAHWLTDHPEVDVVRFTTFFYQFSLVFDERGREKFVDWFGYGATVSVTALEDFERRHGYALRPEDFVDAGYYNSTFRVPGRRYLDWVDFVAGFVTERAAELVTMAHEAGRTAIMFLGDQWIGTEPYGPRFAEIGLDGVVGSVGDGTTLRMISDIPHVQFTEGRFLPYFFPDTFYPGNDPAEEAAQGWVQARRAILRKPVDRMGYGGYLSLASKAPAFVAEVERITDEFRGIHDRVQGTAPTSTLRVAVLNAWGALRTWQAFTVAHALHSKGAYSYYGILESLSGMAVDVVFTSFADVVRDGVPADVDVVVLAGDAGTAFSGGRWWDDEALVTALRSFTHGGGGLVGVGEPTALARDGRWFQLADCFGVDREVGHGLSTDKHATTVTTDHFLLTDLDPAALDVGEGVRGVFALDDDTVVLERSADEVHLAARQVGRGRSVYVAGLPFSSTNTRLLLRALHWAAHREEALARWTSSNPECEVNHYPAAGVWCVVNNADLPQSTDVGLDDGTVVTVDLAPRELVWRSAT